MGCGQSHLRSLQFLCARGERHWRYGEAQHPAPGSEATLGEHLRRAHQLCPKPNWRTNPICQEGNRLRRRWQLVLLSHREGARLPQGAMGPAGSGRIRLPTAARWPDNKGYWCSKYRAGRTPRDTPPYGTAPTATTSVTSTAPPRPIGPTAPTSGACHSRIGQAVGSPSRMDGGPQPSITPSTPAPPPLLSAPESDARGMPLTRADPC